MSIFFKEVFTYIEKNKVHSVTVGNFRMAKNYLKRIVTINPTDPYILKKHLSGILPNTSQDSTESKMTNIKEKISEFIDESKVFIN